MNNTELRKLLKETVKCLKIICGGIEPKSDVIQSVEKCVNDLEHAIESANTEYGNTQKPMVVESFSNSIFKTYGDQEDDKWYILRCTYVEETNNGYVYNIGRRPILEHVEQNINVKLSQRPTENDLENIWKEAVRR